MNFLRGIVAKVFVYVLFGLLIVSFAIWGIGDIFRGTSGTPTVASVGDQEVQEAEFRRVLAQEYSALRQRVGGQLDPEMARAIGLPQQVLNQLIVSALFAQQSDDLGLAVTDETLRAEIVADPRFQDSLGTFDRNRFQAFLRNQRLSEAQFLERLKAEVVRDRVVRALSGAVEVPQPLAEALYRFQAQTRVADYVELPLDSVEEVADPDAETLQSFYEEAKTDYMAPEYRSVTYIHLRPQALMTEMAVGEEELRQAYEERLGEFGTPETRGVSQMVFDDKAAADAAVQRLDEGADFASLAEELTGQAPIDFGQVTRGDLPAELAEAAFALDANSTSLPVETGFGWHVLKVGEVQPGETPSFAEVRDQLREDLLFGRAIDELVSIANQLDDELAGGASLEEAAQTLNLPLESREAVARDGTDRSGAPLEGLAARERFLESAFTTEAGETSLLLETDGGGYFVLRVDGVSPAAPRPLEDIRDQVVADWKAEERAARLLERAGALAARLREGQTLSRVAEAEGLAIRTTPPLTRNEADPEVTPSGQLPGQLFGLEVGEVTVAAAPEGQIVAVLREIIEADPQAATERVAQLRDQLETSVSSDLLNLYGTALERDYGIRVDQAAVDGALTDF